MSPEHVSNYKKPDVLYYIPSTLLPHVEDLILPPLVQDYMFKPGNPESIPRFHGPHRYMEMCKNMEEAHVSSKKLSPGVTIPTTVNVYDWNSEQRQHLTIEQELMVQQECERSAQIYSPGLVMILVMNISRD